MLSDYLKMSRGFFFGDGAGDTNISPVPGNENIMPSMAPPPEGHNPSIKALGALRSCATAPNLSYFACLADGNAATSTSSMTPSASSASLAKVDQSPSVAPIAALLTPCATAPDALSGYDKAKDWGRREHYLKLAFLTSTNNY